MNQIFCARYLHDNDFSRLNAYKELVFDSILLRPLSLFYDKTCCSIDLKLTAVSSLNIEPYRAYVSTFLDSFTILIDTTDPVTRFSYTRRTAICTG